MFPITNSLRFNYSDNTVITSISRDILLTYVPEFTQLSQIDLWIQTKRHFTHFCERYLVVYLDLRESVVVSQRINQSLNSCTSDEVGFQVQTLQRVVGPQHVTEGLR